MIGNAQRFDIRTNTMISFAIRDIPIRSSIYQEQVRMVKHKDGPYHVAQNVPVFSLWMDPEDGP